MDIKDFPRDFMVFLKLSSLMGKYVDSTLSHIFQISSYFEGKEGRRRFISITKNHVGKISAKNKIQTATMCEITPASILPDP